MSFWNTLAGLPHRISWVTVGGSRLRYLEAGAGDDVLVFVHGLGGQLELFLRNIPGHVRDYRVIALDLPGHGYSDKPAGNYEIAGYVDALTGFLNSLGLAKVRLVGLALGGWICARFAAQYPQRVTTLSLIAPGGFAASPDLMAKMSKLSAKAAAGREGVRDRLEWLIKDKSLVTDELVDLRWATYSKPDYQAILPSLMCLQRMEIRMRNLLSRGELASILAPTFLAWTTEDPIGSVADGQAFARAIPDATFILFENSIHMPQFEEPDRFDGEHLTFLAKNRAE